MFGIFKKHKTGEIKPEIPGYGYQPKGYITREVDGKEVKVPVAGLRLIPPKSGTAVVRPGRK